MRPSRALWLAALLLAFGAAVVGMALVLSSHRVQVAYHDWRMHADHDAFLNQQSPPINGHVALFENDDYHAYEYHRDRLVELGAVDHLQLVLTHVVRDTPEATHFLRWLLTQTQMPCIDWASPVEPGAPIQLTLWCYTVDAPRWRQLVKDRDTATYAQTFMSVPDR